MGLSSQIVKFVNYNNFESFLLFLIKLLAARNLFDEFLYNYSIVVVCLAGSNLNVEIGGENNALNRSGTRFTGFELLHFTLDFVHRLTFVESLKEALC